MNKENETNTTSVSSSPSSEKLGSTDQRDESESEESLCVPESLIGVENYLSLTEGKLHSLSKEELTEAAAECKKLILDSAVCSNERKWLVRRLIELRYQLLRVEEVSVSTVSSEPVKSRIVAGHHFELRCYPTAKRRFCDVCAGLLWEPWNFVKYWYQCPDCRYRCHVKGVDKVTRPCPQLVFSDKPIYEKNLCPEVGLAAQDYQCAECKVKLDSKRGWMLCDYTGLYYCVLCHWNNSAIIPARVTRNWDRKCYPVCRASFQLLKFSRNMPLLRLDPRLYGLVKELGEIKRLREELSYIKLYLVRCRDAKEERKLLWNKFGYRSHLLEPSEVFSLQDLTDLETLLEDMRTAVNMFTNHITKDCALCVGQGYRCEICLTDDKDDVIFPFYSNVYVCTECSWVYHRECWVRTLTCRKCERNKRKSQENLNTDNGMLEP